MRTADIIPAATRKTGSIIFYGILQRFQILLNVGPLKLMAGIVQTPFQLFSQDQRQKAAKHVAPDIFITLMVYRPGLYQRFDISK